MLSYLDSRDVPSLRGGPEALFAGRRISHSILRYFPGAHHPSGAAPLQCERSNELAAVRSGATACASASVRASGRAQGRESPLARQASALAAKAAAQVIADQSAS